jgi:hypothetical protein
MFIERGFRLAVSGLTAGLVLASAVRADIVVDTFETNQGPVVLNMAPGSVDSFQDGAGILQTERNIRVTGASVAGGAISANVTGGQLTVTRPSGSSGGIDVWWDGNNSSTSVDPVGLGGVDLTAGGLTGFAISTSSSNSTALEMLLVVYTDSVNISSVFFTLPAGAATLEIPFAHFELIWGAGATFTNVGAIYLSTLNDSPAWTFTLSDIRIQRLSTIFLDGFEDDGYCSWSNYPC